MVPPVSRRPVDPTLIDDGHGKFDRLLKGQAIDDARLFQPRLRQWQDHDSYDRTSRAQMATLQTPQTRDRRSMVMDVRQFHNELVTVGSRSRCEMATIALPKLRPESMSMKA